MSSKPCRCKHCLTIPDNCRFGNIKGTPEAFYRQPLQYYIDHRQQMQQQNQNAMIELVEAILPRLLPYGAHSDRDLKAQILAPKKQQDHLPNKQYLHPIPRCLGAAVQLRAGPVATMRSYEIQLAPLRYRRLQS
mmetsp:Transcript_18305/g.40698  ORF Transcript_18305/g.40698 Transcript_18305/m.40698 type:complete len:134 (-) Transcript_18305:69-470(-)